MKIKVQSDEFGWPQMDDWLAELRDDDRAGPPGNGHAGGDGGDDPWPAALAQAGARAETASAPRPARPLRPRPVRRPAPEPMPLTTPGRSSGL